MSQFPGKFPINFQVVSPRDGPPVRSPGGGRLTSGGLVIPWGLTGRISLPDANFPGATRRNCPPQCQIARGPPSKCPGVAASHRMLESDFPGNKSASRQRLSAFHGIFPGGFPGAASPICQIWMTPGFQPGLPRAFAGLLFLF